MFIRPRSWLACHFKYDFVVVLDSCVLFKCVLIFIYAGSACSYHCMRFRNSVSTCLCFFLHFFAFIINLKAEES